MSEIFEPAGKNARRALVRAIAVLLGVAVVGAYVWHALSFYDNINDDAFITFRYSKFLTLGRGPYFNPGEHVEGYTNLLTMLLMAGALAAGAEQQLYHFAKWIGIGGGALAILSAWGLARILLRRVEALAAHAPWLAWLAGALVAVNSAFAVNSGTGLETTMFSGWILLALWLVAIGAEQDRWRGAGIAFALGVLSRPEGTLVFGAALLGRLFAGEWRSPSGLRRLLIDVSIVAACVAALLVFRLAFYDGELVPNTYFAKRGGVLGQTGAGYFGRFIWYHFAVAGWLLAILPLVLGNAAVRRACLPSLLVYVYCAAAVLATGADWMLGFRLLVPCVPVWAALAAAGLALTLARLYERPVVASVVCGGVLLVGLWQWQDLITRYYHSEAGLNARGYVSGHEELAAWLNKTATAGQEVALMDIGIVGFRCIDLRILDITGLTDRFIAQAPGGFLDKKFDPAYVFDRKPEFLVIVRNVPLDHALRESVRGEAFTSIEQRLVQAPAFAQHYLAARPVRPGMPPLERLAAHCGADVVFEFQKAQYSYMLCVHRRQER